MRYTVWLAGALLLAAAPTSAQAQSNGSAVGAAGRLLGKRGGKPAVFPPARTTTLTTPGLPLARSAGKKVKRVPRFRDFKGRLGQPSASSDTSFKDAVRGAIERYGKPVSFEDPQRKSLAEIMDFFARTGAAMFNDAKPSGSFQGGRKAKAQVEAWLRDRMPQGQIRLEDLILEGIRANDGNVTLAMGTLAEILHDHRKWAAKVDGLSNNTKDYYRFAGAFVGLQSKGHDQALGYVGSHLNILGNPIVYTAGGAWEYAKGKLDGDAKRAEQGKRLMTSRWSPKLNGYKVAEFNKGFAAAEHLKVERKVEQTRQETRKVGRQLLGTLRKLL